MKAVAVSWLWSIGIALTTAISGGIAAGFFGNKAVHWYNVPVREGAQGYAVLFQIIFGAVGGLIVGFIASRFATAEVVAPLARSFLTAHASVLLIICAIAGVARLRAHVPPEIGGEKLMLALEYAWPTSSAPAFKQSGSRAFVSLTSPIQGNPGAFGPVWTDRARVEGDRTIVPAFVEVFTSRDDRVVALKGMKDSVTTTIPLSGYPGKKEMEWSAWTPTKTASGSELAIRYRVVKRSEPLRTDTVGNFTFGTVISAFETISYDDTSAEFTTKSQFSVRYKDAPIAMRADHVAGSLHDSSTVPIATVNGIVSIRGDSSALVLNVDERYGPGSYCLLREQNGNVVCQTMGAGTFHILAHEMSPATSADAAKVRSVPSKPGTFYRDALVNTALYQFPECVLDMRTFTIHPIKRDAYGNELADMPPVGVAPDVSKFARVLGDIGKPSLAVFTTSTGAREDRSVSNTPSPTGDWMDVDQAWFNNYYEWKHDADGTYNVVPSPLALAMPHRGRLKQEPGYRQYDLSPVDSTMGEALIEFMIKEMGGERLPAREYASSVEVKFNEGVVHVMSSDNRVSTFMERGSNTIHMVTLARKFDAALATRRYDSHFLKEVPE